MKKGEWTKLAVTWTPDGGTLRVGSDALPFTFYRRWQPTAQACFFGRHAVGAIDEVRIYDRPLTADEIAAFP